MDEKDIDNLELLIAFLDEGSELQKTVIKSLELARKSIVDGVWDE